MSVRSLIGYPAVSPYYPPLSGNEVQLGSVKIETSTILGGGAQTILLLTPIPAIPANTEIVWFNSIQTKENVYTAFELRVGGVQLRNGNIEYTLVAGASVVIGHRIYVETTLVYAPII